MVTFFLGRGYSPGREIPTSSTDQPGHRDLLKPALKSPHFKWPQVWGGTKVWYGILSGRKLLVDFFLDSWSDIQKKHKKITLPFNDSNLLNVSSRSSPFEEVSGGQSYINKTFGIKTSQDLVGFGACLVIGWAIWLHHQSLLHGGLAKKSKTSHWTDKPPKWNGSSLFVIYWVGIPPNMLIEQKSAQCFLDSRAIFFSTAGEGCLAFRPFPSQKETCSYLGVYSGFETHHWHLGHI